MERKSFLPIHHRKTIITDLLLPFAERLVLSPLWIIRELSVFMISFRHWELPTSSWRLRKDAHSINGLLNIHKIRTRFRSFSYLFWIYYPICICGKYSTGISNHPISWSRRMVLPFFWILVQLWKDCRRGQ